MIDHEKPKKLKNHQGYDIWGWVKLPTYYYHHWGDKKHP